MHFLHKLDDNSGAAIISIPAIDLNTSRCQSWMELRSLIIGRYLKQHRHWLRWSWYCWSMTDGTEVICWWLSIFQLQFQFTGIQWDWVFNVLTNNSHSRMSLYDWRYGEICLNANCVQTSVKTKKVSLYITSKRDTFIYSIRSSGLLRYKETWVFFLPCCFNCEFIFLFTLNLHRVRTCSEITLEQNFYFFNIILYAKYYCTYIDKAEWMRNFKLFWFRPFSDQISLTNSMQISKFYIFF